MASLSLARWALVLVVISGCQQPSLRDGSRLTSVDGSAGDGASDRTPKEAAGVDCVSVCDNRCVNLATDPDNCGMCGKKCSNSTTTAPGALNHGVPRCSGGACVAGCGQGYRLCDDGVGGYSCVGSVWDMERISHIPGSCGRAGARLSSSDSHSSNTSIELRGTGDPERPECFSQFDDTCSTNPTGDFTAFPGSTVSVWIKTTVSDTRCWLVFDGGRTSSASVPPGTWTQLSWWISASAPPTARIQVMCDLAAGATWYVDDLSLTQR